MAERNGKTNLTVYIDKDYHHFLNTLSFKLSVEEDSRVSVGEVVSRAINGYYAEQKKAYDDAKK